MNIPGEMGIHVSEVTEGSPNVVSWAAILAGAAAAAAVSLILIVLGLGLGLSSFSPWSFRGTTATALTAGTIIWLLMTAIAASGLGGYIAGRLRSRWNDSDGDETHFRDTAHGFLAWSVATLLSAAVLSAAASAVLGTTAKAAAGGAGGAMAAMAGASNDSASPSANYFVDMLFRGAKTSDPNVDTTNREVRGILAASRTGEMPQGDRTYLGQLVANRTGLAPADADARVAQVLTASKLEIDAAIAKAKEAADTARKTAAYTALWVFVSLLVGAFYSSLTATWGGRQRDPQSYLRSAA